MENNSTPEATNNDAGGNDILDPSDQAIDHSQNDDSQTSAESTQESNATNNDGATPPSDDADTKADTGETDQTQVAEDAPALKFDDDLDEWADKSGRGKPETDRERQLLQDIRNGQRALTQDRQSKKLAQDINKDVKDSRPELSDDDEPLDPVEKELQELKTRQAEFESYQARAEYFQVENVSKEESEVMQSILKEKVERGMSLPEYQAFIDPKNISDWHTLAKSRLSANTDNSAIEQQAAAKERERLAKVHQATPPNESATQTVTSDKSEDAERLDRFSNWD